uniref:Kinesin motor domain-containing protein n=1 Tax=Turnera subulata TaxID=218843 RepID=A0A516IJE7_9ROSI
MEPPLPENCCSVKVSVHIRPLVDDERAQGCKECVAVTPRKPQVQIGAHSFTFDHVYGNAGGSPPGIMFEECVAPLVEGLFQGYNGTVLAYGQTGSGKTYTMGTGFKEGCQSGVIPQVMDALFTKIEMLKHQSEFQLHVSFIEILKEEVRDLLDSESLCKSIATNGKVSVPGRPPIQIRESSNGVITLAGTTEVAVSTLQEMATCLEQGSLSRATGSTNMNNQSSRSHAIFTITLEQMRKVHSVSPLDDNPDEDMGEEYFCAKLHLVDLAGSERAKRTGSDGLRLKEGIHINKGLLALGNVISALGDEKKRKEGVHVPYRDSKLTRLLQDSLGGNSKTVMIACISPADINAEETLNTLKYANRARNIQNKPVVNRDLISSEMQQLRQQLKYLQAELCARESGSLSDEVQLLKEKITWLEATNKDLSEELHEYRSRRAIVQHYEFDTPDGSSFANSDGLKRNFQSMDSYDYSMDETITGGSSGEIDEAAKEWEHALKQSTMDKELNELNKRLEQKESEMKLFGGVGTEALKHHFRKKIMELEEEKRIVQAERDHLLAEIENLAANSDEKTQKAQDGHTQNLKSLEAQILQLKKKQESQVELLKQKQRSDEAAKRLQAEIQYIKGQKVKLQHKIKQEAEQFRLWKASREKELLQLRKEGRRNEYERHKLEELHQRQKMVVQRKTEEAAMATKRLKELLEARKFSARENGKFASADPAMNTHGNEKSLQKWLHHELEVMVKVHEVRIQHEKQRQHQAALAEELTFLKQVDSMSPNGHTTQKGMKGHSRFLMSPNARMARIASLENMLSMSSNGLMAMASQLSEAGERERTSIGRGHWNQIRSMGEAKSLLQYMFNAAAEARCQLWEKDMEIKDMKDQLNDLVTLLRQSEAQKKELVEQKIREQAVAIALATPPSGRTRSSNKHRVDDTTGPLSPRSLPAPKQLKFSPGIANGSVKEAAAFLNQTRKMVPVGQLSMRKVAAVGQSGKLWRWKRSHHQWLLQFKWKWQKPWKLSEWIKHSDETIMRSRTRTLVDMV